jgi:hypothetical protein
VPGDVKVGDIDARGHRVSARLLLSSAAAFVYSPATEAGAILVSCVKARIYVNLPVAVAPTVEHYMHHAGRGGPRCEWFAGTISIYVPMKHAHFAELERAIDVIGQLPFILQTIIVIAVIPILALRVGLETLVLSPHVAVAFMVACLLTDTGRTPRRAVVV